MLKKLGKVTIGDREIVFWDFTDYLKIGDYVQYVPTEATFTPNSIAGSTTGEISTETNLKWRYMGVDKDGNPMLISATPTTTIIRLKGVDGYNYGVTILDEACETLYSSELAQEVRNVKIEDIENRLNTNILEEVHNYNEVVKYGETKTYISESKRYTKYPYIYEKEIGGIIGETPTTGELGVSDKGTPSQSGENKNNTKITVMQTYWERYMQPSDFLDTNGNVSYYDLFIIDDETQYYISSRYVENRTVGGNNDWCTFGIRRLYRGTIRGAGIYSSFSQSTAPSPFRPIVTLVSNIQVVDGNGDENMPWIIE